MDNPLRAMWSGRLGSKHFIILLIAFWVVGRLQAYVVPTNIPLLNSLIGMCLVVLFSGVMTRRLNDFNGEPRIAYIVLLPPLFSFLGWGFMAGFTGIAVMLASIVIAVIPGTFGVNRHGAQPKGPMKFKTMLFGL